MLCVLKIHIVLNAEEPWRQSDGLPGFDVFLFQSPPKTSQAEKISAMVTANFSLTGHSSPWRSAASFKKNFFIKKK